MIQKNWVYRRGDIYFANLGDRIGSEQSGTRPVIVIQNNVGNRYAPTLTVLPITSNIKKPELPTHVVLQSNSVLKKKSMIMAEQAITIDKERIISYVGKLNFKQINRVMDAVRIHIGIEEKVHTE